MQILSWLKENYVEMLIALSALIGSLELITRLTPTKTDDAFMERVGSIVRKILDFLKIPNVKK